MARGYTDDKKMKFKIIFLLPFRLSSPLPAPSRDFSLPISTQGQASLYSCAWRRRSRLFRNPFDRMTCEIKSFAESDQ